LILNNVSPLITGQNALSTPEDTALAITLADLTVTDPDNTYPTDFTLTVLSGADYTFVGNTLTPASNFNGSLTVPVKVNDGMTDSSVFNLTVTVTPVNDAPVITEGPTALVSMSEDGTPTPFSLTLNATDIDGDTLTWSISSTASHGLATAAGTGPSKAISYTPNPDYSGVDSFVIQVSDGNGGVDTIIVNVTISAVNNAPTISQGSAISVTMSENGAPYPFDLTLNANDLEGNTLTWSISAQAGNGAASALGTGASKLIGYLPAHDYTGLDSFVVQVNDGNGGIDTITVNVTINQSYTISLPLILR
jgi:hypothetical protein